MIAGYLKTAAADINGKASLEVTRRPIRSAFAFAVLAALFAWFAIVWLRFVGKQVRFYSPLPYYDYWITVSRIAAYRQFDLSVLWQQHNEHRIVFPEIVFALDYLWFRGREILPVVVSCVCYASILLFLSAPLWTRRRPDLPATYGILLAGIVLAWQGGANLISTPFALQWSLELGMVAMALFFLTEVTSSRRPRLALLVTIVACVVANYSSANGLFFWAIIVLVGWILRVPQRQLWVLVISAAISIASFFIGYQLTRQTNFGLLLAHPIYAISFMAAYLAMPFTAVSPRLGVCFGLFEIVVYLLLISFAVRRGYLNSAAPVILFAFYSFCVFTAAVTAAGRMDPRDWTFGAATAHRYILTPLAGHAALILAGASLLSKFRYYLWTPFLGLLAVSFLLVGNSKGVRSWIEVQRNAFANIQLASLGFESYVDDIHLMNSILAPGGKYLEPAISSLRRDRLSTFVKGRAQWLGKAVSSIFPIIADQPTSGAITGIEPLESGLLVLGWTDSQRSIWSPREFVLVDDRQRIVGFGRQLPAGLPRAFSSLDTPESLAWAGFVNQTFDSKAFRCYAVGGDGKWLIPIGQSTPVPAIRGVRTDEFGPEIPNWTWNIEGHWRGNGTLPAALEMPPGTSYYESWAGSDSNIGALSSYTFPKPPGSCVVLSGAHGPSTDGLSYTVFDADTNRSIASVPLVSDEYTWRNWRVELRPEVQRIRIVAEDRGRGWGQWQVIGEPHLCYGFDVNREALILGGNAAPIPSARGTRADEVGPEIPNFIWDVKGHWLKNGALPAPLELPSGTWYYESWAGGDSNSGAIASHAFPKPSGGCMILSGAHGPSIGGLAYTIFDADTNKPVASVPFIPGEYAWRYWRVELGSEVRRIRIVAEDEGREWGQWQMIGQPHFCK